MDRNMEYKFVETKTDELIAALVAGYERITGITVQPASPEKLFIQWVSNIILQERVYLNYVGNQNIPSRAEGENLDALGELFFMQKRPTAQAAVCTERFRISAPQLSSILVPKGTRVTDASQKLFWETIEDAFIPIGGTFVDVRISCQTVGAIGNGYTEGQINTIVDVFDYYTACSNITASEYGADAASDDEFYELLRSSMDGYSSAGSSGGYIYYAKMVSTDIGDVVANQPSPGCVNIYVLKEDGTLAGTELKAAVLKACSADEVRPLTDHVAVNDGQLVSFDIDFTYYISSSETRSAVEIDANVQKAVSDYVDWQTARFGRNINPDKLREYLFTAGIKRVELVSPVFTVLRNGSDNTVPQVAKCRNIQTLNGGYEDE